MEPDWARLPRVRSTAWLGRAGRRPRSPSGIGVLGFGRVLIVERPCELGDRIARAGAWLARYGELQNSLFLALARPLGLAGAGGRDAFGDLFQIAVTAAWARERDGEPIRHPRAFLRQVIVNQRKMQLRTERRHPATSFDDLAGTADGSRRAADRLDRRPPRLRQRAGRALGRRRGRHPHPAHRRAAGPHRLGATRRTHARRGRLGTRHHAPPVRPALRASEHRKLLAYLAGDWCAGHAARFARLAANRATPTEAKDAREHLDACPSCRTAYETFTRLHPSSA